MSKLLDFASVMQKLFGWIGDIFMAVLSIIPKTLYLLCTFAMQLVDVIQLLFQKLAGLDVYYVEGSSTPESGDFLVYFLRKVLFEKGTLNTVFWSLVIVALFLLVFATIVAVVRTQYNYDDKPVSPTKIVGQAIKSLFSFAIVPIVAFIGVFLGNIFLRALNSATTVVTEEPISFAADARIKLEPYTMADGTKTYAGINLFGTDLPMKSDSFSGMIFRSAAYRANRIRNDASFRSICNGEYETQTDKGIYSGVTMGMFEVTSGDYETAASRLDDAFALNYRLDQDAFVNRNADAGSLATDIIGTIFFSDFTTVLYASPYKTFNRYNVAWVWFYYDLWQFDFVMAIGAIIAFGVVFLNITTAMMKRAIELTMLTAVSPLVISVAPLDGGSMQKKWRGEFIKKTLSAYGAVVGVNLIYIILPIIREINFFNIPIVDTLVQMFFTIVALASVKDFLKMLSDIGGTEDANAVGAETNKKAVEMAAKVGKVAMPAAGMAARFATKGIGARGTKWLAGKAWGGIKEGVKDSNRDIRARINSQAASREYDRQFKDNKAKLASNYDEYEGFYKDRARKKFNEQFNKKHKRDATDAEWEAEYKKNRDKYKKAHIDAVYNIEKQNVVDSEVQKGEEEYQKNFKHSKEAIKHSRIVQGSKKALLSAAQTGFGFVGAAMGQVVEGAYGDKLYDSYKGIKGAAKGKPTSSFFGAVGKDAKEEKEKKTAEDARKDEASFRTSQQNRENQMVDLLTEISKKLDSNNP